MRIGARKGRLGRTGSFAVLLWILAGCSAKHQPVLYTPYFAEQPDAHLSEAQLQEEQALEKKAALTQLEKKRLLELYYIELKQLKTGTPRAIFLTSTVGKLGEEVRDLERERMRLQVEASRERSGGGGSDDIFGSADLKARYLKARKLWNQNDNEPALAKLNELKASELFKDASRKERERITNLMFHILFDLGRLEEARKIYAELKDLNDCGTYAAQAGLKLAIWLFGAKQTNAAREVFLAQCDRDETAANLIRRDYWWARFNEKTPEAEAIWKRLAASPWPTYYAFMAQRRLGRPMQPVVDATAELPFRAEFETSGQIHSLLLSAEGRLNSGLRRDAGLFLTKAGRILRESLEGGVTQEQVVPALYTASLLHASGAHLEALKLYSALAAGALERIQGIALNGEKLLSQIYPSPFRPRVSGLADYWGVDPDLVYSIMRQESAFNPGAISSADARGLMQLIPPLGKGLAAQWGYDSYFGDKVLFRADENLRLAIYHLYQLRKTAPHFALIVSSYNAGIQRVAQWWQRWGMFPIDVFVEFVPIAETRNYIKLVLRNYVYYHTLRTRGGVTAREYPEVLPAPPPTLPLAISPVGRQEG